MMVQFLVPHVINLSENGFHVEIACSNVGGRVEEIRSKLKDYVKKIHIVRLKRSPLAPINFAGYHDMRRIINTGYYDLIWTNEPVMGVVTRLAARRARKNGTKVMYMTHGFHFFKGAPRKNWLIFYNIEQWASRLCDVITTIDVDMQDIAEKALVDQLETLNAVSGVAVVMEVATGDVKANVNMTRAGDGHYYEMRNASVSNLMEPGSTFKTASIMVALEDGYITPDYEVDTGNGVVNMHGSFMKDWNWYRGGYGKIDVTRIMEVSSNVGVSTIIDRFYKDNPQKFVDGLKRMSIDKPLDLGFVGEASPRILGPKERYFAKTTLPWMSIGYETMFPPIYLLNFYNAIANNGTMVKPKFVKAIMKDGEVIKEFPTEIVNPKICSDTTLMQIRTILRKVVSEGLAKPAGSKQFNVSGKTGTAQVALAKEGYLVSFCGYFPSEAPQYSCIVSIHIPHGPASGGLQAGSVFSRIAERIYAKHLNQDLEHAKDSTSILVPDVKNGDIQAASYVLQALDINSNAVSDADTLVWGKAHTDSDRAELTEMKISGKRLPNVRGMGAKDAVYLMETYGLKVRLAGVGKVVSQSIAAGSYVRRGQTIKLTLK